jgi:hypothetical protein
MRPTRVAPVAPQSSSSTSGAGPIYGSGDMPSLERSTGPAAVIAPKGFKQEQMEKELRDTTAKLNSLKKEIQGIKEGELKKLQTQILSLQVQAIQDKTAFDKDKERIHSKGMTDGEILARKKMQDEMQEYEKKHMEMQGQLKAAQAEYPELKRNLEADIVRREASLDGKMKVFELRLKGDKQQRERMFSEANQFDAEVKRNARDMNEKLDEKSIELKIMEQRIRDRKSQRSDYRSYRGFYRSVRDERRILDDRLKTIRIQLAREREKLDRTQQDPNAESDAAVSDDSQITANNLFAWEKAVEAIRKKLDVVDEELAASAHYSRLLTSTTRFKDTRLAADSTDAILFSTSVEPLRNVKRRVQSDIDDTEALIEKVSNATTREELTAQLTVYVAERMTVNSSLELAHMDRNIQILETLKREPYVHKAALVTTFDLEREVALLSGGQANSKRKLTTQEWANLRDTIAAMKTLAKKRALVLEAMGQHGEHEQRLDAMIDEKIADLVYELQTGRARHFDNHRSARAAARRAPAPVVPSRPAPLSSKKAPRANAPRTKSRPPTKAFDIERKQLFNDAMHMKHELKALLLDKTVSLDPNIKAEKVRQYNALLVLQHDYEIRVLEEKLIDKPRLNWELKTNEKIMTSIRAVSKDRKLAQYRLENGVGPRSLGPNVRRVVLNNSPDLTVVAGTSETPPEAREVDEPNASEPLTHEEAEEEGRSTYKTLRAQLDEAKAAGDHEKVRALKERDNHSIVQAAIRKIAALGPKTAENAEKIEGLEMQIKARGRSQTRRERLRRSPPAKVNALNTAERARIRAVEVGVRKLKLKLEEAGLSDAERKSTQHEYDRLRLEILQKQVPWKRAHLKSLGPKTADNAARHELLTFEIRREEARVGELLSSLGDPERGGQVEQGSEDRGDLTDPLTPEDNSMSDSMTQTKSLEDTSTIDSKTLSSSENKSLENMTPSSGPTFNGLKFTPTAAKQAIHQLWAEFVRRQALRERRPDKQTTLESGPSDVSAVLSADHATADDIADISTEATRDDDDAKSHMQAQAASASLAPETPSHLTSYNTNDSASTMADTDEDFHPTYEISSDDKKNALIASRNATASFWKYSLYKNAAGETPTRHYCTTFEQTEAQVAKFLGEKVVGFDLEWEKFKSKPGEDSAKRCVSLVQIAAEDKVALFHLAVFRGGDSTEELMPPSLRAFLENPKIIKVGVNIGGDATRLRNCFGVEMQGNIELSHLYKLVTYGESNPAKVNRGLYALANQVKEVLHLPLAKGAVRTSSWSKRLNGQQTEYAASDAYAGLRLYYELERRRKAMESKPPRPAFHELGLPVMLGEGQVPPTKTRRGKQAAEVPDVPEEPIDEAAAFDDASEDSEDIYDDPQDLEAFDAYVESQEVEVRAGAALPEITYPTLPPLEDLSDQDSDQDDISSLPSDPLTKPATSSRTPALHSPEAVTADAWATAWQAQLPATYSVCVSQPQLRAYHLWHHQGFDLKETAALLRKEPLALSTVVSYIAEALQKEDLEFDAEKVREVRARLPASVRGRYAKLYAGAGNGEV